MKKAIPNHMKISQSALLCMQQCTTEFILFIQSEANDIAKKRRSKRVSSEDILEAMHALDLDCYATLCELYMHQYRRKQEKE